LYTNIELINKENLNLKVKEILDYSFASELTQIPITLEEFFLSSTSYPTLFVQNGDSFATVAIVGIKENQNLMIDKDGKYSVGEYVPAFLRRYPFILVQTDTGVSLGYDKDSNYVVNRLNVKGKRLFESDGSYSDTLKNVMDFMKSYDDSINQMSVVAEEFNKYGLLKEINVNIDTTQEKLNVIGMMTIDEEKLGKLKDKDKKKLVDSGLYKIAMAQIISQNHWKKLIDLYADGNKVD
jgi:hypothetical protein